MHTYTIYKHIYHTHTHRHPYTVHTLVYKYCIHTHTHTRNRRNGALRMSGTETEGLTSLLVAMWGVCFTKSHVAAWKCTASLLSITLSPSDSLSFSWKEVWRCSLPHSRLSGLALIPIWKQTQEARAQANGMKTYAIKKLIFKSKHQDTWQQTKSQPWSTRRVSTRSEQGWRQ